MEAIWEEPAYTRFVERLAASFRVVLWDKRGTGLSDRVPVDRLPSLEQRMDDMGAVLDAVGAEQAAIVGMSEGGVLAAVFGATHPDRTQTLVVYGGWGATVGDDDYSAMPRRTAFEEFADSVQRSWDDMGPFLSLWAVSHEHDPVMRDWWTRALHRGASPASAVAWLRMIALFDIRSIVGAIQAPTLVLHRSGTAPSESRTAAGWAPTSRARSTSSWPARTTCGGWATRMRCSTRSSTSSAARPPREPDRVLATVLFTDIVDSTRRATELGDRRWRDLIGPSRGVRPRPPRALPRPRGEDAR